MHVGWMQYLIACPLAMLAGFVDAVAGGGGLISLPECMIAGLPVHYALGTNKLGSGMGTIIATGRYAKKGYIPWKQAALCLVGALVGSGLGARLALLIDEGIFRVIMLFVLPLTALYVTRGKALNVEKAPYSSGKTAAIGAVVALGIGLYDGFYGPGSGTFLILALTAVAHMNLRSANGVSKAINLTTDITSVAVYWMGGKVLVALGLAMGVFSIAGNWLGARFFEKRGAVAVKPIMLTVLLIFFVRVILEQLGILT